jgi:DNA primase large subunit
LHRLLCRHILDEPSKTTFGDDSRVSLDQVPALAQRNFPLCMQHLYSTLIADRHLRHAGRMQLGLFLKKAGLSLEEALLFWKTSFAPRTTSEKFEKEYAYNVRHNYGKEGSRKDYEAHNCSRIIAANPGVGEAHGCPFKTFQADALKAALSRSGVPHAYAHQSVLHAAAVHSVQWACFYGSSFGQENETAAASIPLQHSCRTIQAATEGCTPIWHKMGANSPRLLLPSMWG